MEESELDIVRKAVEGMPPDEFITFLNYLDYLDRQCNRQGSRAIVGNA